MCIDFIIVASQVIYKEQVETVLIPLQNKTINLQNIVLAIKCNSNLIFLGQLQESKISFYDNLSSMTLMKDEKVIAQARRSRNLFVLDLASSKKAMRVSHIIDTHSASKNLIR